MRVGTHDTDERVFVIAEVGNNHEGSVDVARELVRAAAAAGADAVKFQTFLTEQFVSRSDEARFARLEGFRLTHDEFAALADLAHECGLVFASTPLDLDSARFLVETADVLKVASGDNDFYPLIDVLARSDKPLVVSTGLADLALLDQTTSFVEERRAARGSVALTHCVSAYPAPGAETNLRAIGVLAARYPDWTIGYSDHTLGIDAVVLAVAAGARLVEKHFTLDKQYSDFRDHQLSADPAEFEELVGRIREAETLLGDAQKRLQPSEEDGATAFRRSVAAARDLPSGHVLEADDLTWLRPGGGHAPGNEDALLGRPLRHDVAAGDRIGEADVG